MSSFVFLFVAWFFLLVAQKIQKPEPKLPLKAKIVTWRILNQKARAKTHRATGRQSQVKKIQKPGSNNVKQKQKTGSKNANNTKPGQTNTKTRFQTTQNKYKKRFQNCSKLTPTISSCLSQARWRGLPQAVGKFPKSHTKISSSQISKTLLASGKQ